METRYEWMGVQGEWFHRKLPVHLTYNLVRNGCSTAAVAAPSLQDDAWSRLSLAVMPYGLGAACKCPYSMLAESQSKTGLCRQAEWGGSVRAAWSQHSLNLQIFQGPTTSTLLTVPPKAAAPDPPCRVLSTFLLVDISPSSALPPAGTC